MLATAALAEEPRRGSDTLLVLGCLGGFADLLGRVSRLARELARFGAPGDLFRLRDKLLALVAPGERPGPVHHMAGTECTVERSARAPKLSRTAEGGFLLAFTEIGVWSSQAVTMSFDARHQGIGGGDVISRLTP